MRRDVEQPEVRRSDEPRTILARRFLADWCAVSEVDAEHAKQLLIEQDVVRRAGEEEINGRRCVFYRLRSAPSTSQPSGSRLAAKPETLRSDSQADGNDNINSGPRRSRARGALGRVALVSSRRSHVVSGGASNMTTSVWFA